MASQKVTHKSRAKQARMKFDNNAGLNAVCLRIGQTYLTKTGGHSLTILSIHVDLNLFSSEPTTVIHYKYFVADGASGRRGEESQSLKVFLEMLND
jgi:hypothetical protein